jgi:DNA primase
VRWAQPDKARLRYLRQWMGYNLTGDMGEQIFHIWYGPLAANGKSTIGNVCREAIGDYGDTINVESFLDEGQKKRGDQATPDLVRLPGVRFLTAGEPPKGAKINEALINSVTGGDPMNVRDNFRSFFRFNPLFKFTLWCNDLPSIPQGTAGIWRRVKVIPWEQHLTEEARSRPAEEAAREYAGVLAWMVRGLLDWLDNGFVEPEAVQLASADYKHDSDPLSNFLRLCTVPDPEAASSRRCCMKLIRHGAKAVGEYEWKQKGFSQALKAKGLAAKGVERHALAGHAPGEDPATTSSTCTATSSKWTRSTTNRRTALQAAARPPHPPLMTMTMRCPAPNPSIWKGAEGSAEGESGGNLRHWKDWKGRRDNSAHTAQAQARGAQVFNA